MIPMIHFTLHQNQTDDKCSPNSQAITTTSTEWWRRGGNTTLTVFTLSLSEEIFMCKVVFIFAKIPYKQNIIYLFILVTDVRVPIRCVLHMQVDLSRVDLTFAHVQYSSLMCINKKFRLTVIPVYCGNAS